MTRARKCALGAGPHAVRLLEEECFPNQSRFEMSLTYETDLRELTGHGNTPREAAQHLAAQLREVARLIDAGWPR